MRNPGRGRHRSGLSPLIAAWLTSGNVGLVIVAFLAPIALVAAYRDRMRERPASRFANSSIDYCSEVLNLLAMPTVFPLIFVLT
jgi:hypothetical protein